MPTELPPRLRAHCVSQLPTQTILTHHWLTRRRGGEKVLEALYDLTDDAAVYTLIADPAGYRGPWSRQFESPLRNIPGARKHYPKLLGLLPWAARGTKLPPADLVLCSDASLAKAMRAAPGSRVVCYCHSPMRYVWEPRVRAAYAAALTPLARPIFHASARRAQLADAEAATRVDLFIANSQHVAARIRQHYGRDSIVVHPPVELPSSPTTGPRDDYYLCVGQHVPYKRLDLAIEACAQLGKRLVVIGGGPDVARFQKETLAHVSFLGWQPDEVVHQHYRQARGLLFCGEEDFGIVPVEAQAYGCPVIAYGLGGATETVVDQHTGVLFSEQSTPEVTAALQLAETLSFDPEVMFEHCQQFSLDRFHREILAAISS